MAATLSCGAGRRQLEWRSRLASSGRLRKRAARRGVAAGGATPSRVARAPPVEGPRASSGGRHAYSARDARGRRAADSLAPIASLSLVALVSASSAAGSNERTNAPIAALRVAQRSPARAGAQAEAQVEAEVEAEAAHVFGRRLPTASRTRLRAPSAAALERRPTRASLSRQPMQSADSEILAR